MKKKNTIILLLLMAAAVFVSRCEDDSETESTASGTANYQLPQYNAGTGLNLGSPTIQTKPIRQAIVEAVTNSGDVVGSGKTDDSGSFSFKYKNKGFPMKIRVVASIGANSANSGYSSNDTSGNILVRVADNTSNGAVYSIVSDELTAGDISASLTAAISNRGAAPFAILDTALNGFNLMKTAESSIQFSKLTINWSVNNTSSSGNKALGQIGTSHWDGSALYILGKSGVDTDEYDLPVVGHEFGHYVESTAFRSDSIGGSHSNGNKLDPRVAFGEGFGNAFGSILRNDPTYYDTSGTNNTTTAVSMDMEAKATPNQGLYNESSVQAIIWDLYDTNNDGTKDGGLDNINGGFNPIFLTLRNHQKTTTALTTILSFVKGYKDQTAGNPLEININNVVGLETIGDIDDAFGALNTAGNTTLGNTCRSAVYRATVTGAGYSENNVPINFNNDGSGGSGSNKYCATQFYKINYAGGGAKTITMTPTGCDADIYLYKVGSKVAEQNQGGDSAAEVINYTFVAGADYVLDVRGWGIGANTGSGATGSCTFNLSIP